MSKRVMGKSIGVLTYAVFLLFLFASSAFSANECLIDLGESTIAAGFGHT
ncbi:MAG: hypothetical protein HY805_02740, partial [Nitrospirae bacterium]|nr:hypothetical protein [Nitrospirota bacterium]